jgi:hypothetical protein
MLIIQHQELTSAQATITFSSIPQTFTDLYLAFSVRVTTSDGGIRLRVNGATTSLSGRLLYGTGSSVATATETTYLGSVPNSGTTANTFSNGGLYLPNYSQATTKPFSSDLVDENNGTTALQWINAGLYNSTTAITALELFGSAGGNFVQYSSATLYGITKGSDGIVTVS